MGETKAQAPDTGHYSQLTFGFLKMKVILVQGMALALSLVALAAWLLWDWVQHKLRARERELANALTQDLDVDSIKRLVGEVRWLQHYIIGL